MTQYLLSRSGAHSDTSWSNVCEDPAIVQQIRGLCHTPDRLGKEGYVIEALSDRKILEKLRCENCARNIRPPEYPKKFNGTPKQATGATQEGNKVSDVSNEKPPKLDICTFHPEGVVRGAYTCCGTRTFTPRDTGCYQAEAHEVHHDYFNVLQKNWQYYNAPLITMAGISNYRYRLPHVRTAVALDCEFGTNKYNQSELIRLTAIDFFTKEILIDVLVNPSIRMKHYNTKYSGVRKIDIELARRNGVCILGRDKARETLLRYVDGDTILIVHGGSGDLTSLRLIHPWIIDTHILDQIFFEVPQGGRGLKSLCKEMLDIDIQTGRSGHDSVEDALACRELLLSQMESLPEDYVNILEALQDDEEHDAEGEEGDDDEIDSTEGNEEAAYMLRNHADQLLAFANTNFQ